jgi:hypothetical protein
MAAVNYAHLSIAAPPALADYIRNFQHAGSQRLYTAPSLWGEDTSERGNHDCKKERSRWRRACEGRGDRTGAERYEDGLVHLKGPIKANQDDADDMIDSMAQMAAERKLHAAKLLELLFDLQTEITELIGEAAARRFKVMEKIADQWASVLGGYDR